MTNTTPTTGQFPADEITTIGPADLNPGDLLAVLADNNMWRALLVRSIVEAVHPQLGPVQLVTAYDPMTDDPETTYTQPNHLPIHVVA